MSKKYYSIPRGIVRETTKEIPQNFDLKKFTKRMLNLYNVPFVDVCCDDGTFAPVRYNTVTGNEEFFDFTGADWSIKPSATALVADSINVTTLNTESIVSDNTSIVVGVNTVQKRTGAAYNVTATATAADVAKGLITSTSAAAVALTLPLATALAIQLGAVQGTSVDLIVDNSVGANIVTVTLNTGITAIAGPVITGGATLTVAASTVGMFRIYFISATVAKIARIF